MPALGVLAYEGRFYEWFGEDLVFTELDDEKLLLFLNTIGLVVGEIAVK